MKAHRGKWEEEREEGRLSPFLSSHRPTRAYCFLNYCHFYRNNLSATMRCGAFTLGDKLNVFHL